MSTGSSQPIRVAVIGAGRLGAIHAQTYHRLDAARLVAVCDSDARRAGEVAGRFGCRAVADFRELLQEVDAVSIAVPTTLHYTVGMACLTAGLHVLLEKPMATSLAEADALIAAAHTHEVALQIGHVERFNAALQAARAVLTQPRFIEVHRLSPYPKRSLDISVVLDVMIHDLDIVLQFVTTPVTRLDALGLRVLSSSEDIVNARLEFAEGAIANLTASRVSEEPLRKFRIFQEHAYLSLDYGTQSLTVATLTNGRLDRRQAPITPVEPLAEELAAFLEAVRTGAVPAVPGEDGRAALALALDIETAARNRTRTWLTRSSASLEKPPATPTAPPSPQHS